jgi:prepilin-type N-terminal cleavage/methylation domain-containing protein/prepilin-type processing-associated H-X9-DG protein
MNVAFRSMISPGHHHDPRGVPDVPGRRTPPRRLVSDKPRALRRRDVASLRAVEADRSTGFSLIELIVVLAILGLLIGLLMPAIGQSRAAARRVDCMNRLRNITMAMLNVADNSRRFPASGNFTDEAPFEMRHSWVVDVLPWLEQGSAAAAWDKNSAIDSANNEPLTHLHFPILVCPADISVEPPDQGVSHGNLSYVVNGGVGHTAYHLGIHDCPIDLESRRLDLNGDGFSCPPDAGEDEDKTRFFQMGMFFNETWMGGVSERHHTLSSVTDGLSNTALLSENVRTGYNPGSSGSPASSSWASPGPQYTSFYIGAPCENASCNSSTVDYGLTNRGIAAINSGRFRPEGSSWIPNSFHLGGVNMSFADGRVQFLSERLDGRVYAALTSPQGGQLSGSVISQDGFDGGGY